MRKAEKFLLVYKAITKIDEKCFSHTFFSSRSCDDEEAWGKVFLRENAKRRVRVFHVRETELGESFFFLAFMKSSVEKRNRNFSLISPSLRRALCKSWTKLFLVGQRWGKILWIISLFIFVRKFRECFRINFCFFFLFISAALESNVKKATTVTATAASKVTNNTIKGEKIEHSTKYSKAFCVRW